MSSAMAREQADDISKKVMLRAQEEYKADQEKPGGQDLAWHLRRQVFKLSTSDILNLALSADLLIGFLDTRLADGKPLRSFLYDKIVEALWPWTRNQDG